MESTAWNYPPPYTQRPCLVLVCYILVDGKLEKHEASFQISVKYLLGSKQHLTFVLGATVNTTSHKGSNLTTVLD